jgi:hypothetical protein
MTATASKTGGRDHATARPERRHSASPAPGGGKHKAPRAPVVAGIARAGNQAVQRCVSCHGAEEQLVQRACGGGCVEEQLVQRQAVRGGASASAAPVPGGGGPLEPATRSVMESRFGRDFGAVRVHTGAEADRAASGVNARAFTLGQDIVFAGGQYDTASMAGQRLLAHELTHTIQQAGAPAPTPQRALRVSAPGDALEREAEQVASQVVDAGATPPPISAAADGHVQRQYPGEYRAKAFVEQVSQTVSEAEQTLTNIGESITAPIRSAGETIVDIGTAIAAPVTGLVDTAADLVSGFARDLWDGATALANALGGVVSIQGTSLVIDVPEMPACPELSFQFSLAEISKDFPFLAGTIPLGEIIELYGEVGLHTGFTPELSAQVGPCTLHSLRIVVNPLGPSFSASGSLTATVGLGLGGELRTGLFGEVGVLLIWPDPPIIIQIPVAHLEAGLAGFARGIALNQLTVSGSLTGSLSGFAMSTTADLVMGLAADLGAAGYGALSLLGLNVCTLYWPLWAWHDQMTVSTSLDVGLTAGPRGISANLSITEPKLDATPFESLPLDIPREMFHDECPLCEVFQQLGLMPSQNGGEWRGHPTPPWAGPLSDVYARDPKIPSGSLCRGACGPNCDTCSPPEDRIACNTTPDGRHHFWLYPNYQVCGTHEGCRQHDAGYDWCATAGEVAIWGPCHRLPDFECLCNYNAPQCVGWIGGAPPNDGEMDFSDQPSIVSECVGPCPQEEISPQGVTTWRVCLPQVTLMGRKELFQEFFANGTGDRLLWSKLFVLPYIFVPILVEVFGRAEVAGGVSGGFGPIFLSDVCLDVDPFAGLYAGSGELHIQAGIDGSLSLTGTLGAKAGWGCLLTMIKIEGSLTGRGHAGFLGDLIGRVDVSCRDGELVLDASASLEACLKLLLGLDAGLLVELFGFPIISESWTLAEAEWNRCWRVLLGVTSMPFGGGVRTSVQMEEPNASSLLDFVLGTALDDRHVLGKLVQSPTDDDVDESGIDDVSLALGGAGGDLTMPEDPAAETGQPDPCPLPSGIPTVIFDKSAFPNIAPHIKATQALNRPSRLTRLTNRSAIRRNRRLACGGFTGTQSCDEYPFASSHEGGANALTASVPLTEQHKQGGTLSSFYQRNKLVNTSPYDVVAKA